MRPLLRPGAHVLQRGPGVVQVGLDPRHAVVLRETGSVRATLDLLETSAARSDYLDTTTLDLLEAQGLLVEQASLLPLVPGREGHGEATRRHAAAALALARGDEAPRAWQERETARIAVVGFGGPLGQEILRRLVELLEAAGLRVSPPRCDAELPRAGEVAVLVGTGEPDRELLDGWMRSCVPHLVVRMAEGAATLGPFVVPGSTACLRCLDAHATDADPSWPLLVTQYARRARTERPDGVPEPVDLLLASVALAWAARDLASYVEGRRPSTYSSTLRLDPHLSSLESELWLRHPDCGCAWT